MVSRVSKRVYSSPKLSQFQAMFFSEMDWGSSDEEESFQHLRPLYLVYQKQEITPVAIRFKFEGDKVHRYWQAIGSVPASFFPGSHQESSHGWLLLGYVPPAIPFGAKLICRDTRGRHGVAIARKLVADKNKPFELAYLASPAPSSMGQMP
ncbi:MAG: hypothetical protein LAN71_00645 [Acidobacteriia bacterium]|nr:hypothetical protein [Terriglobia bacterium]